MTDWEVPVSCDGVTGDVYLSVVDLDATRVIAEATVPCTDFGYTFENVPREQLRVMGDSHGPNGEILQRWQREVDLRDGIDVAVRFNFAGISNFRIAWTFENGTCDSYNADSVEMEVGAEPSFMYWFEDGCHLTPYFTYLPEGQHGVRLRARHNSATESRVVAASPIIDVTIVAEDQITDVSTVLSPCDGDCEP